MVVLLALGGIGAAVAVWALTPEDPARLMARAEAAARSSDWPAAQKDWRAVNQTRFASAQSFLGEARASLALDSAAQAERALIESINRNPADPAPWLLRLWLLHVEDRTLEAKRLGWAAYRAVPSSARRDVLRGLTLALLTETPDDLARPQLDRWISGDPADVNARVALLSRVAAQPHAGDPDRATQISTLSSLLASNPEHLAAREALLVGLAGAGEVDRGRDVLNAWPSQARDARYYRLQGRWDLDYNHQPTLAIEAFRRALAELPHDWRTHYRLSRALRTLSQKDEADQEALTVTRLREILDSGPLGTRLAQGFAHLDDPKSCRDLAQLCTAVGLDRLASAWRLESEGQPTSAKDLLNTGSPLPPPPH
ncbi:MAG TPA: tetratricopeptide repeat protein [Isosphaeraceae bacterium]|nr:tetratricopeptide repeat protein [Isosphaeraceae bacterium]